MRREVNVAPLTDSKALLMMVSCEMGAYNVIDLAFKVARGLSLTLPFTPPHGER